MLHASVLAVAGKSASAPLICTGSGVNLPVPARASYAMLGHVEKCLAAANSIFVFTDVRP
jgi:hypothetical protein